MSLPGILSQAMVGATDQDKVYYYLNDHLGTPLKMVDESGIVVWEAEYEPFGEAKIGAQSLSNNYRFPGQYFDSETGLQYNYHRYYDPAIGRYLSPDPIGLSGGINIFVYTRNNPINFIDPQGLYCKIIISDPIPGGNPLAEWLTEKKIGYRDAVAQKILFEIILAKSKLPHPDLSFFEYKIRFTTWQLLKVYIFYWEVCYDDCTGEETSRTLLGKGETGKTEPVIVNQKEVKVRL
jgi:RHS repeat-associated protein